LGWRIGFDSGPVHHDLSVDRFDAILLDDLLRIFDLLLAHDPDAGRLDHLQCLTERLAGGVKLLVGDLGVGGADGFSHVVMRKVQGRRITQYLVHYSEDFLLKLSGLAILFGNPVFDCNNYPRRLEIFTGKLDSSTSSR